MDMTCDGVGLRWRLTPRDGVLGSVGVSALGMECWGGSPAQEWGCPRNRRSQKEAAMKSRLSKGTA